MKNKNVVAHPAALEVLEEWIILHFGTKPDWLKNNGEGLPHKAFHTTEKLLLDEKRPNEAEGSWRFFLPDTDGTLAAYVVRQRKKAGTYIVNGVSIGPEIAEEKKIVENTLKNKPDHEFSFVVIPKLKIRVYWFYAGDPKDDIFIPVRPSYYGLKAGKSYTRDEFIHVLLSAARTTASELPGPEEMSGG